MENGLPVQMSNYRSDSFFLEIRRMSNLVEVLVAHLPPTLVICFVLETYQESVANLFP